LILLRYQPEWNYPVSQAPMHRPLALEPLATKLAVSPPGPDLPLSERALHPPFYIRPRLLQQ
jgi:hypothetical protein